MLFQLFSLRAWKTVRCVEINKLKKEWHYIYLRNTSILLEDNKSDNGGLKLQPYKFASFFNIFLCTNTKVFLRCSCTFPFLFYYNCFRGCFSRFQFEQLLKQWFPGIRKINENSVNTKLFTYFQRSGQCQQLCVSLTTSTCTGLQSSSWYTTPSLDVTSILVTC